MTTKLKDFTLVDVITHDALYDNDGNTLQHAELTIVVINNSLKYIHTWIDLGDKRRVPKISTYFFTLYLVQLFEKSGAEIDYFTFISYFLSKLIDKDIYYYTEEVDET